MTTTEHREAAIEPVAELPAVRITRDFAATPAQLVRAHTDQNIFKRWVGPHGMMTTIDRWDGRTGGNYRYCDADPDGNEYWFYGSFHFVGDDRLVQTFTWEGMPDSVSLETVTFEELGDGLTRLRSTALFDSFEARDGMLSSGMDIGVNEGYESLDGLLAEGAL